MPSASDLVRYSVALGARGLGRDGGRKGFWRIWMPLDVDRVVELPWAAERVIEADPTRVLDLAGPKLLSCWLAEHTGAEIVATDLWQAEIDRWRKLTRGADRAGDRFRRLALECADATRLPYADASFDAAVSVSVIEHIPDQGDTSAMRELARVLRPDATLVLTFPYGAAPEDIRVEHDLYGQRYNGEPIFFYRRYAPDTVAARLLGGGEFETVARAYWDKRGVKSAQAGRRRVTPARWELGRALGPLLPVIGRRATVSGSPDAPGTEGVISLVLRRRRQAR
jgi:SAM-dependent methyltransferase